MIKMPNVYCIMEETAFGGCYFIFGKKAYENLDG